MHISAFIKRHPVLSFYLMAFAISWGGMLMVVIRGGLPRDPAQLARMIPVMILAMLAGPIVASILITGVVRRRVGYRELFTRLLRWRVGVGWYAVVILTAPLVLMAAPLALSVGFPGFIPRIFTASDKSSILLMGFTAGLAAGCFEELGWTGFVVPKLRLRCGTFSTGVVVGLLWGAWHVPVNILASGTPSGGISIPSLVGSLLFSFGVLPAYRVLMIWVWDHTGSLLVAMLMHMSLTASNIILGATTTPGMMAIRFNLTLAAAMCILAALATLADTDHGAMHVVAQ